MNKHFSFSYIVWMTLCLLGTSLPLAACWWTEEPEVYRIAMFQAETPSMRGLRLFRYQMSSMQNHQSEYSDSSDRLRNMREWQRVVGRRVPLSSIWEILYDTPPPFAYSDNDTTIRHSDNAFLRCLAKPRNREWLKYLIYAKQNEACNYLIAGYEPYYTINPEIEKLKEIGKQRLDSCTNKAVRQRYAFMLMRLFAYESPAEAIRLYNTYFKASSSSIISVWALFFKALALDKLGEYSQANYNYSLVFDKSGEKRIRAFILFSGEDGWITPKKLSQVLAFAKNNRQRSVLWTMHALQNPAPTVDILRKIYTNMPDSPYLETLIAREVNKIEDWLLTPTFTPQKPAIYRYYELNRKRDLANLRSLCSLLRQMLEENKGLNPNFLASALAHLYLIDEQAEEGQRWLSRISDKADPTILQQRNIDEFLLNVYAQAFTSKKAEESVMQRLRQLEKEAAKNGDLYKTLYGMLRSLVLQYEKRHDFSTAALLFVLSEQFKAQYADSTGVFTYDPEQAELVLDYLDRKASEKDIDHLLQLRDKKRKSVFEKYLLRCSLPSKTELLNVKGMIAFRRNDLYTAYKAFSLVPPDTLWNDDSYSNNDPFTVQYAPAVEKEEKEKHYVFHKAEFVKRIIELQKATRGKQQRSEAYLQLGNAYLNCTYWGKTWWMFMNFRTCFPTIDLDRGGVTEADMRIGSVYTCLKRYMPAYFHCTKAIAYYEKALCFAGKNAEIKAQALAMLFACRRYQYHATHLHIYEPDVRRDDCTGCSTKDKNLGSQLMQNWNRYPILRQMRGLQETKTLQELADGCPLLEVYLARPLAKR